MHLDRRQFLRVGTITLIGAAVAACTKDKPKPAPGQPTTTEPTTTSSGAPPSDIALLKTAASLEALAVGVYQRVAGAALVKDPAALDTTTLFLAHHNTHQLTLNELLRVAEVSAVTAPNGEMDSKIFQPALTAAKTQDDIVQLLFILEEVIAQTYVYGVDVLARPEHRVAFMTIAGIQARHRALLGLVFAKQNVDDLLPNAFAKSSNPLPADAILN
ncbi:MAG: hypothetical protein QOD38_80 [Acidimicrobiaceae bacterium]